MANKKSKKLTAKDWFLKVKSLLPAGTNLPWSASPTGEVYAPRLGMLRKVVPVATMSPEDAAIVSALTHYFVAAQFGIEDLKSKIAFLEDAVASMCDGMKRPHDLIEMGCTPEEAENVWSLYKAIAHKRGYTLHEDRIQ